MFSTPNKIGGEAFRRTYFFIRNILMKLTNKENYHFFPLKYSLSDIENFEETVRNNSLCFMDRCVRKSVKISEIDLNSCKG